VPVGGVPRKTAGASKTNAADPFYAGVEHGKNVTVPMELTAASLKGSHELFYLPESERNHRTYIPVSQPVKLMMPSDLSGAVWLAIHA
jgi:hypothetical protein